MVAAVAFQHSAAVMRMIGGTAGRERAQPIRGEQMAPACAHDVRLIGSAKGAVREAYGKYLIGPDAGIVSVRTIDHVVQSLAVRTHEACKALFCGRGRGTETI